MSLNEFDGLQPDVAKTLTPAQLHAERVWGLMDMLSQPGARDVEALREQVTRACVEHAGEPDVDLAFRLLPDWLRATTAFREGRFYDADAALRDVRKAAGNQLEYARNYLPLERLRKFTQARIAELMQEVSED